MNIFKRIEEYREDSKEFFSIGTFFLGIAITSMLTYILNQVQTNILVLSGIFYLISTFFFYKYRIFKKRIELENIKLVDSKIDLSNEEWKKDITINIQDSIIQRSALGLESEDKNND